MILLIVMGSINLESHCFLEADVASSSRAMGCCAERDPRTQTGQAQERHPAGRVRGEGEPRGRGDGPAHFPLL